MSLARRRHYELLPMGAAEMIYDEMIDLFARGGGAGSILAFRPSAQAQVSELLDRSRAGTLTDEEQRELERFGELERLMQLVKARARRLGP